MNTPLIRQTNPRFGEEIKERERVKKLEELREADVLTAEEFQEALEKIGGETAALTRVAQLNQSKVTC